MSTLTKQEQDLVQHVEVYGMNPTRAGALLGVDSPHDVLKRPHVQAARESLRRTLQQKTKITKEDVINGMKTAIDQALELGDPTAQIRGWSEIAKLHNMYEATKVDIRVTGMIKETGAELAALPVDKLLELAGPDSSVIDVDFYRVDKTD